MMVMSYFGVACQLSLMGWINSLHWVCLLVFRRCWRRGKLVASIVCNMSEPLALMVWSICRQQYSLMRCSPVDMFLIFFAVPFSWLLWPCFLMVHECRHNIYNRPGGVELARLRSYIMYYLLLAHIVMLVTSTTAFISIFLSQSSV